ncbi:MAG: hypothetical protein KDD22_09005, partial [Bdellovibrionales bacterium]|nr:hypothetical protein [Bdellovibrionales bacterium]
LDARSQAILNAAKATYKLIGSPSGPNFHRGLRKILDQIYNPEQVTETARTSKSGESEESVTRISGNNDSGDGTYRVEGNLGGGFNKTFSDDTIDGGSYKIGREGTDKPRQRLRDLSKPGNGDLVGEGGGVQSGTLSNLMNMLNENDGGNWEEGANRDDSLSGSSEGSSASMGSSSSNESMGKSDPKSSDGLIADKESSTSSSYGQGHDGEHEASQTKDSDTPSLEDPLAAHETNENGVQGRDSKSQDSKNSEGDISNNTGGAQGLSGSIKDKDAKNAKTHATQSRDAKTLEKLNEKEAAFTQALDEAFASSEANLSQLQIDELSTNLVVYIVDIDQSQRILVVNAGNEEDHSRQIASALDPVFKQNQSEMTTEWKLDQFFHLPVPPFSFSKWVEAEALTSYFLPQSPEQAIAALFAIEADLKQLLFDLHREMPKLKPEALDPDNPVSFNAYLYLRKNQKYYRYLNRGRKIEEKQIKKMDQEKADLRVARKDVSLIHEYCIRVEIRKRILDYLITTAKAS